MSGTNDLGLVPNAYPNNWPTFPGGDERRRTTGKEMKAGVVRDGFASLEDPYVFLPGPRDDCYDVLMMKCYAFFMLSRHIIYE